MEHLYKGKLVRDVPGIYPDVPSMLTRSGIEPLRNLVRRVLELLKQVGTNREEVDTRERLDFSNLPRIKIAMRFRLTRGKFEQSLRFGMRHP
jgi:hypothetical protein